MTFATMSFIRRFKSVFKSGNKKTSGLKQFTHRKKSIFIVGVEAFMQVNNPLYGVIQEVTKQGGFLLSSRASCHFSLKKPTFFKEVQVKMVKSFRIHNKSRED